MKSIIAVTGIVCLIFFSSCQREADWNVDNPTNGDSTLISKVIYLDTTLPAPIDSVDYDCFLYDQQKRVSFIYHLERIGLTFDTSDVTQLFYQNNDTVPYKGVTNFSVSGNRYDFFKYYDMSGRTIKDSLYEDLGNDVWIRTNWYTYLTNRLRIDYIVRIPSAGINDTGVYYMEQHRTGNNIFLQKDTTLPPPAGGGIYATSSTFQYDNRPNPLRKIWAYYPFYWGDETVLDNFSENNFTEIFSETKELQSNMITNSNHIRFYYNYGTNGLPKFAWEKDVNTGDIDKYVYIYTK